MWQARGNARNSVAVSCFARDDANEFDHADNLYRISHTNRCFPSSIREEITYVKLQLDEQVRYGKVADETRMFIGTVLIIYGRVAMPGGEYL